MQMAEPHLHAEQLLTCHPGQFISGSRVHSSWCPINWTPVILECDFLTKHNLITDFSQQAVNHSDNPSFKLHMPLVKMSSCNTLALDDEIPQAVPTTVKNTMQWHTNWYARKCPSWSFSSNQQLQTAFLYPAEENHNHETCHWNRWGSPNKSPTTCDSISLYRKGATT